MNKQSLYVLGGALLASTALTTAGQAAIVQQTSGIGATPATTAITTKSVATEVFSATAVTATALTLFTSASTLNGQILIDFAANLSAGFNVQLNVTGAAFTGTVGTVVYAQTSTGVLRASISVTGCSTQVLPDKILITGCTPQGTTTASRADAIAITGMQFYQAQALATAGNAIKLDGLVMNAAGTVTFEVITQVSLISSKSAVESAIQTGSSVTIDNNATPAFSTFTSPVGATATLGTIHFSTTSAYNVDFSNQYLSNASLFSGAEVKITHSALSDPSLLSVAVTSSGTKTLGDFVSGTVSFRTPAANLDGATVSMVFNGTSAILASSGTASVTVTPGTVSGGAAKAPAAVSGSLAALSRGGLSTELNTMQPTAGLGSTLYRSYMRIANTSALDGVATITVKNDGTGALIGSFTTTITAGSTKQLGSADIEANISTAAATGAMYKVVVSGSFNGYVQLLMWNSVTGIFSDLSGFRNGALTADP